MVKHVLPWIKEVVAKNKHVFKNMRDVKLMMDRAPWHKKAIADGLLTEHMGLPASALVGHPPNSPDLQGPIEWSHAHLVSQVKLLLSRDTSIKTPKQLQALVKSTWDGTPATATTAAVPPLLSPEQVAAQFRKLEHTYRQVIAAKGNWGQKGN